MTLWRRSCGDCSFCANLHRLVASVTIISCGFFADLSLLRPLRMRCGRLPQLHYGDVCLTRIVLVAVVFHVIISSGKYTNAGFLIFISGTQMKAGVVVLMILFKKQWQAEITTHQTH